MSESGISFTPVTPLWPQANAEAENFNNVGKWSGCYSRSQTL